MLRLQRLAAFLASGLLAVLATASPALIAPDSGALRPWKRPVKTPPVEAGQYARARELIHDAQRLSAGTCYEPYDALLLMADAYSYLVEGKLPDAHRLLSRALATSRSADSDHFFRWMIVGFRRMLAEALRAAIEPDYVRSLIAEASGFDGDPALLDEQPSSDCSRDACVAVLRKGAAEWRLLATRSNYRIDWAVVTLIAVCQHVGLLPRDGW